MGTTDYPNIFDYVVEWVAVKGRSLEAVHAALGMKPDGEPGAFSNHEQAGTPLPNGWYGVFTSGIAEEAGLAELSRGAEVVFSCEAQGVCQGFAYEFKDGERLWKISYDYNDSWDNEMEVSGEPPAPFPRLRRALERHAAREVEPANFNDLTGLVHDIASRRCGFEPWKAVESLETWQALEIIAPGPPPPESRASKKNPDGSGLWGRLLSWLSRPS